MFKIVGLTKKNNDWLIVSLVNNAGEVLENVSVNRTNKKGEIFPNFDDIAINNSVEGQLWKSPSDKWYLFAPKSTKKTGDSGPAARDPGLAEIKNILTLQIKPMLEKIYKEVVVVNERDSMNESKIDSNKDILDGIPF